MCLGSSQNRSMKTSPSPNAATASDLAMLKDAANDACVCTSFMPLPPPPAAAFMSTGKPIFLETSMASFSSESALFDQGSTGTFSSSAIFLACTLLPMRRMTFEVGPMNLMPHFSQASAKPEFSARKP